MSTTAPRYIAIAHVDRVGEIEHVNLCDNQSFKTCLLYPYITDFPQWFTKRVTLMRFCPVREFIPTIEGRKYTDYMIGLHLTSDEYKQLTTLRISK